ncbi:MULTISPECIES: YraN family protein [unclassified Corynebacterium]|uniref:YraN family protein n=1 Tax=unclassified Corynebacterium TaxID=2624378 RepID=UPI0035241DB2
MPTLTSPEIGRVGEDIAAHHYRSTGHRILARNVSYPVGEIDLIAETRDGTVVFVEVKTRSTAAFGGIEAVSCRKVSRMRRAAALWLSDHPAPAVRFDAVLILPRGDNWGIECWEDFDGGTR